MSTVPSNGDQNPYGVAFVPDFFAKGGLLEPGDILVSNFNGGGNLQGTGTTIIRVPANGSAPSVFFQGTGMLGLSTGLGTLQYGFVLVANLPTEDGTAAPAKAGHNGVDAVLIKFGGRLACHHVGDARRRPQH